MYNWSYQYYRSRLDTEGQQAYDIIYRAWFTRRNRAVLPRTRYDSGFLNSVLLAIAYDHPEVFWVDYFEYKCVVNPAFSQVTLEFSFFFHEAEIRQWSEFVTRWKRKVASQLPDSFLVVDKTWLLFDYLARQVTYGEQNNAFSHTIIGPASPKNHVSVCEGLAKSFKYLCDGVGIPCLVVDGTACFGPGNTGPHAWNIVETEVGKRHVDVTGELEYAHFTGRANKSSFLHLDSDMKQYSWDTKLVPACV